MKKKLLTIFAMLTELERYFVSERILHLHALGVLLATIVNVHLKYGEYLSLKNYLSKLQRQPVRNASA